MDEVSNIIYRPLRSPEKRPENNKFETLIDSIKHNIWGYDFVLCLFVAALKSFRSDHCLRPFPPRYLEGSEKDFRRLKTFFDQIPNLKTILQHPLQCSEELVEFLLWIFVDNNYPLLKRINLNSFPFALNTFSKPHYLFEIVYPGKIQETWQNRIKNKNVILAYHGSNIENFYSILKVGLQQHLSIRKETLFGNGIYLSTDISISVHYSPFNHTWPKSDLGSKHSVIALCEIIYDSDKVKCKGSQGNDSDKIPDKYFIVTDSDMVRVKYLMVYKEKTKPHLSINSWFTKFFFLLSIMIFIKLCFNYKLYTKFSSQYFSI